MIAIEKKNIRHCHTCQHYHSSANPSQKRGYSDFGLNFPVAANESYQTAVDYSLYGPINESQRDDHEVTLETPKKCMEAVVCMQDQVLCGQGSTSVTDVCKKFKRACDSLQNL